ncbi:AAA family ATPase [Pseudofrankia inefficax]|uniref:Exodeoxyribonuclease V n=1 Tax=Pseudofrankia inefficax (strain DSM 45817 / CECT 9037 / DDB 130130 / EuI1c) TaxID=298654 RepID=E3J2W3_PSEI1|nr:AAA family ATPase [Pseudofrankia inefficax]ADP81774.1 Exodeoxyribonuclease V [Pseudofrankia inefficax]
MPEASSPVPDPLFAAFCAAGLWPGLGRTSAERLPAAGIRSPADVDLARLSAVEGMTGPRARRLLDSFRASTGRYEVAGLLADASLPVRLARGVSDELGASAADELRADPWALLAGGEADLTHADRLARSMGLGRDDPRRGPGVLVHLLTQAASRAGDTAGPVEALLTGAGREGVPDPAAALESAVEDGRLLPVGDRVGLERYAMAEQAVADGVERLLATAEPLRPGEPRRRRAKPPGVAAQAGTDAAADDDESHQAAELDFGLGDDSADEADHESDEELAGGAQGADGGPAALADPSPAPGGDDGVDEAVAGLDEVQLAAARLALESGVSVLTGGPGTGKSRTVAAVVRLAQAAGAEVALAAPTGRAAKRLEELCDTPASTLHRLLGAQGKGGGFARGEHYPLDAELVVVDEASMVDAELAAALIEALADGTHLLVVGDPAQLPSIGPGQLLADLIESGVVPVTELSRLYRQSAGGAIAQLATAVRGGELPPPAGGEDREVVVVAARSAAEAAHRVVQLVTDSIPRVLGIVPADVQVVTPVHAGPAGTVALNAALKDRLNPGPGKVSGFDVGDRVVATANHLDVGFANGEIGVVTKLADRGGLLVTFPGGTLEVPATALGDLRHGWAVTVHRAQGSEWPAVIAVFPPEAGRMLNRPLVYTAITRARGHLSVVCVNGPALRQAVRSAGGRRRVTLLAPLLAGAELGEPDGDDDERDAAGAPLRETEPVG